MDRRIKIKQIGVMLMKTAKINLNKKILIKAVSSVLSLVLTANVGLNLLTADVFAADDDGRSITVEGDIVTLKSTSAYGFETYYLVKGSDGRYYITDSRDSTDYEKDVTGAVNYVISSSTSLTVCTDYDFETIDLRGSTRNATITIDEGSTVSWESITGMANATIINDGTLSFDEAFDTEALYEAGIYGITNYGNIYATSANVTGNKYSDSDDARIYVTNVFLKDSNNIAAVVNCKPTTNISSAGGTFTLAIGNADDPEENGIGYAVKKITDAVGGEPANDLFDDPSISLNPIPDVLVGELYDFSTYIRTNDGYEGTTHLEYSINGTDYTKEKPTAKGQYYIRAVAPASGTYGLDYSAAQLFDVNYLDPDTIDPDGNYFTYGNVVNGCYVNEKVKVVPAEGYKIYYSKLDEEGFSDYLMLSYDDIFNDYGDYHYQVFFKYKRISDEAETDCLYINADSPLNFSDLIFDSYAPFFEGYILDPLTDEPINETSVDEEDAEIVADALMVRVMDDTLDSVILDVDGKTTNLSSTIDEEEKLCEINLNSIGGKKQVVTITATDIFGHESVAKFNLYHDPIDPDLTVTVSDTYYVGEDCTPVVETNSDGEVKINYYKENVNKVMTTPPTAAGNYEVVVKVAETTLFNSATFRKNFSIVKRDLDAGVSVANTYVGETVTPEMTDLPDDYTGTITYEYKRATDDDSAYDATVPTAAGTYSVRATLPETSKYLGYTCENTFKIFKNNLNASVSVENVSYGETVSPVLLHIPDDYDGDLEDVTYEYKLSSQSDSYYSETVPTAVGTYSLRVTIPETAKYEGVECISTFKINKAAVTASVTVENINVGDTPNPVVTTVSNGKADATFEYKLSSEDESAYDGTVPTDAGTYDVRATIPETASYLSTTCEGTFTISRNPVTASMIVPDIYVGGTISPVVTTLSTGEITYEYKASDALDSEYTPTPPTAAGTYTVRATVAATAYYASTTCTAEFTISKNPVTATVSVADIYVGQTPSPVVTSISDRKKDATFEYKLSTESTYSGTVPTDAGTYDVRATIPESDTYLSTTCESSFTISKNPLTATMTVEDIFIGGTITPVVTTVSTGEITYKYKLSTDPESAYDATVPTAAGTYTVQATIAATATYESTTCTATFTIYKLAAEASVSVEDIFVGQTPSPVVTTVSEGKKDATFEYKLSSEDESAYDGTVPTAAGTYDVRATIPETANYESITCESSFTISRNPVTATMTVADIYVDGTISPVVTTLSTGGITYEYKASGDPDSEYTPTPPTAAGTYTVKATIAATAYYASTTCTAEFTISKNPVTATVSVADIYVGQTPSPVVTSISDRKKDATFEYKLSTESTYSNTVPTDAGTYDVRATIPESDTYLSTTCESSFTISKNPVTATMTVEDIFIGGTISPVVTTLSTGEITYKYKLSTDPDSAYDATVPTAAGTYNVQATIAATATYANTTCTATFKIKKLTAEASVSVANIKVGQTPSPVVTTVSDGKKDATFEYKLTTETNYSSTVPTAAGTYNVRATVPETDTYLSTTCESSFTISKNAVTATMTVADIYVGGTISPVVTTVSTGKVTYKYKLSTASDSAYSSTVPTAAGTYSVKATIAATATYKSTTCESTFTIRKNPVTASVSVANIYVGQTPSPVVTSVSDGKTRATFEYKLATESTYSGTVPTAAGTYNIRATVPETDTYLSTTCEGTFTISKRMPTASVTVANTVVGGEVKPVVTTNSDGAKSYEYKLSSASSFYPLVPVSAGVYTVRVTIAETDKYLSTTCETEFTISKKEVTASVSVADIFVGGEVKPVVTTESNGKADATFEYKLISASAYTTVVPTAAGTYTVRATIPATVEYAGITCTDEFTISLNPVKQMDLKVDNVYVGQTVKPVFKTDSNGKATIMYKASDDSDDKYTTEAPTKAGKYIARATVPETSVFESSSCTAEFTISYLNAPETAFTPEGTEGNNGYFTSDVELKAPEGYKISDTLGGEYKETIPYSDTLTTIYLKRNDGALTSAITISKKPKIDKAAPEITTSEGNLETNTSIYTSDLVITVDDKNLKSLKVNKDYIDLTKDGNILTLSPGYGIKKFTITAEDEAGNKTVIEITLIAEWLKTRIIIPDVALPLDIEENYNLDDGTWTVTVTDPSTGEPVEDKTVYNGNMAVYVNESGDYTFTKVTT